MASIIVDADILQALVTGGSFFGGGGGGSPEAGLEMGRFALSTGVVKILSIDDVPDDGILLTVSAVGSPAGAGHHAGPRDFIRAVEMFLAYSGQQVFGFISNECGGLASVNGLVQAAHFGLPVIDAPCNGRAHPTGAMGSMGLDSLTGYLSVQAACGGDREVGTYVELFVRGSVQTASQAVRNAAAMCGGLVAVARNPAPASYVREHGAPGALRRCIDVGRAMLDAREAGPCAVIEAACRASGGKVVAEGAVTRKLLSSTGGFDVGSITVDDRFEITFMNEYITVEDLRQGEPDGAGTGRIATFPDLIVTMDLETGFPVSSADVSEGQHVAVVVVPRERLILGAGVKDRRLYASVEAALKKEL